jgi:hypothetical protein
VIIAGGLPDGLMLNTQNGEITGTPTAQYIGQVTIQANNSGGSDTFDLVFQVSPSVNIEQPMDMDEQFVGEGFLLINILFLIFGIGWVRREMRKNELGDTY